MRVVEDVVDGAYAVYLPRGHCGGPLRFDMSDVKLGCGVGPVVMTLTLSCVYLTEENEASSRLGSPVTFDRAMTS